MSLTLATSAVAPASASAGSLLSGYGGPGEGNQAILGATLLGGPPGAGGAGGETGSRSTAQSSPPVAAGGDAAPRGSRGKAASGAPADGRRHSRGPASGVPTAGAAPAQLSGGGKSPGNIDVSKTAVLSTADLVYILLALAALAATGVLTRRLAHHPRQTMQGR